MIDRLLKKDALEDMTKTLALRAVGFAISWTAQIFSTTLFIACFFLDDGYSHESDLIPAS